MCSPLQVVALGGKQAWGVEEGFLEEAAFPWDSEYLDKHTG